MSKRVKTCIILISSLSFIHCLHMNLTVSDVVCGKKGFGEAILSYSLGR